MAKGEMVRLMGWVFIGIAAVIGLIIAVGCFVFSAPGYRGPVTDHFDGRRFHNTPPLSHHSFFEFLRWRFGRSVTPWTPQETLPGPPPPRRVEGGELRVTLVGHSTVLIQTGGINILTDPVWSERASPLPGIGPRRFDSPGIRFEDLPPIDVVLITHNHYDHLDIPTIERLATAFHPRIYAGLGNRALLASKGITDAHDLDWWQGAELAHGIRLVAVPAHHFSSRGLCDHDRTLWASFVIEGPGGAIFFAGDTGLGPQFKEIRDRLGSPRLAILPIGAFLPRWFMSAVHLSPEEAIQALEILGARTGMAIHFGAFALGDDAQGEAASTMQTALEAAHIPPDRFLLPVPGRGTDIPY